MELLTKDLYSDLLKSDKTYIILFSAEWCGSCKALKPVLEQIVKEKGLDMYMCKVDQESSISNSLNIQSLPTIIKYQGDKELVRLVGNINRSRLDKEL